MSGGRRAGCLSFDEKDERLDHEGRVYNLPSATGASMDQKDAEKDKSQNHHPHRFLPGGGSWGRHGKVEHADHDHARHAVPRSHLSEAENKPRIRNVSSALVDASLQGMHPKNWTFCACGLQTQISGADRQITDFNKFTEHREFIQEYCTYSASFAGST
jgi:hypothetical protein